MTSTTAEPAKSGKHTPTIGPWEAINREISVLIYGRGYESPIAWVESYARGFGPSRAERDANARLIAAAPDLLAVAQRILDRGYVIESIEEERDDHLALVAAIAKAEGSNA